MKTFTHEFHAKNSHEIHMKIATHEIHAKNFHEIHVKRATCEIHAWHIYLCRLCILAVRLAVSFAVWKIISSR